jgi:glyoxylase-like metal-dependent hydrolase (beta-lactamase superfamily II)
MSHAALNGLTLFERGWLSSNNLLVHGEHGEGALLVDTGHLVHAAQTQALVAHALQGRPLSRIVNTHLHSDHCGGNATLQRAFGTPVFVPPGQAEAARAWDEEALSYAPTGQLCERFRVDGIVSPGEVLQAGGRRFEVIAAPGHDPDSVMLFDADHGLLLSADALWENGFGVVFPELEGVSAFDDVGAVLDLIETLPVQLVVPGHGRPFDDVQGALARARSRLAAFRAHPGRHARHGAKVLLSYHLMEVVREPLAGLRAWAAGTPLFTTLWQSSGRGEAGSPAGWAEALVAELVAVGAATRDGDHVGTSTAPA